MVGVYERKGFKFEDDYYKRLVQNAFDYANIHILNGIRSGRLEMQRSNRTEIIDDRYFGEPCTYITIEFKDMRDEFTTRKIPCNMFDLYFIGMLDDTTGVIQWHDYTESGGTYLVGIDLRDVVCKIPLELV